MGKQTTDRTTRARSLRAAIDTQADEIDRRFEDLFATFLTPEQRRKAGKPSVFLAAIAEAMEHSTSTLERVTEEHERELADDAAPRQARDEATGELVDLLVRVRRSVETAYGRPGLAALGLTGRTPTDTPSALALAKKLRLDLEHSALDRVPRLDDAISVDTRTWTRPLKQITERLDQALTEVAREEREGQDTLRRKNEALTDHDHVTARGSDLIWSLLRLVDLDDAADRLVPSRHQGAPHTVDGTVPAPPPPAPTQDA